jgi:hypothetical protein
MKRHVKPIVTLVSGAVFLLSGVVCPTVRAQSILIESGSSILANSLGQTSGPEVITVSWFVLQNTVSDVYTYGYNINNPAGDVVLNGPNAGQPETVDEFVLGFDATVPGAFLSASQPVGGIFFANEGVDGLLWVIPSVNPGTSSALIAFQSDLGPGMGNASASDSNAPSPWSSSPNGQPVPVPHAAPEPAVTALLGLGLLLLPFRSTLRRRFL